MRTFDVQLVMLLQIGLWICNQKQYTSATCNWSRSVDFGGLYKNQGIYDAHYIHYAQCIYDAHDIHSAQRTISINDELSQDAWNESCEHAQNKMKYLCSGPPPRESDGMAWRFPRSASPQKEEATSTDDVSPSTCLALSKITDIGDTRRQQGLTVWGPPAPTTRP